MKTRFPIMRIITLCFYVLSLLVIQGFKTKQSIPSFPSPLENTILAFYYDFAKTGIYSNNNIASETIKILSNRIRKFNPELTADAACNFVSDFFSEAKFRPQSIYFYMAKDKNFVLAVNGEFPWQQWKRKYPENTVINRENGFSISVPAKFVPGERLSVNISSNLLMICPEDIAGNIMHTISSENNKPNASFPVFQKMIVQKPVIALETKITELAKVLKASKIEVPSLFDEAAHLRVISHKKISKLQFAVQNDSKRRQVSEDFNRLLAEYLADTATTSIKIKNTSVYISAKPSEKLSNKISHDIGGLLLHFMTKIKNQDSIILSKIEKGAHQNDNNSLPDEQKTNTKLSKSNNN